MNTLNIPSASIHIAPNGDGFLVNVVTAEGIQVSVGVSRADLAEAGAEAAMLLTGAPETFHAAGQRLARRLNGGAK